MKFSSSCLFTLVFLVLTESGLPGNEPEWGLQPLKYNNPGLEVDLGVGLWAFPLPIDYDRDGDMDLLVGCPDKPSQGTYFFENPTQDAAVKLPVFKPGVRVGDGYHFMMLSRKDGDSVILRPGKEYRRDSKTGRFDFSRPMKIDAIVNPLPKEARTRGNMWRYVDFEGDGDDDLLIGVGDWSDLGWDHAYDQQGGWQNGPLHGYVYVVMNTGSNRHPEYSSTGIRLQAAGRDVDVYGWPSPNMHDFDGDGDLDLLCGEFLDGFTYFENVGSRSQPEYSTGKRLVAANGERLAMHVQMITPTAVDWDSDGDLDLVVGDEDGRVALVENTGKADGKTPVFRQPQYFRQQADTLKFGALATPYAYDWDQDGDEDLLCGNTAGTIGFFENLGTGENGLPKWGAPRLVHELIDGEAVAFRVLAGSDGSIQGPCEAKWGYTTLSVADWDQDGDGDIVYNSILGKLGLLLQEPASASQTVVDGAGVGAGSTLVRSAEFDLGVREYPPRWAWWQNPSKRTLTQWRTTPVAVDFDHDGSLELVLLDQEGYLTLRERQDGKAQRVFVDESGKPLRLTSGTCGRSGRIKLEVCDWDGDGLLDVLVNSANATWYRNCRQQDGVFVLKKVGNLARRNVAGHTSSPAVCDFDQDGQPDLLVGSENGRIYHIHRTACVSFSQEQLRVQAPSAKPTPRFPGLVQEEFIFTQAPFEQCHASSIVETTRGLVAAWFGGTKEGNDDVGIWTSYHDGLKWSTPQQVADGVQHADLRYPCWNPVLFQPLGDGPTLLFFKVGPNPREWWGEMMVSYDRGRTFRDRRRLPEGIDGPVRCKPVLVNDGQSLLCGSSTEYDGWRVHFELVDLVDGLPSGSWRRIGPINDASRFNAIQPTFLIPDENRLKVLCRTQESVLVASESADGGRSWTPLQDARLPNPNSGIEAVTLKDGRHLLVYNHAGSGKSGWGRRGQINLAISEDGVTWFQAALLERQEDAEFSYPAIIQAANGQVHVTYTWERTRVKHLVIDPDQLNKGPKLGMEDWQD
ncbi:MAG: exo-alpha-sialidase [Aureliella sp.]